MLLTDILIAANADNTPIHVGIHHGRFINPASLPKDSPVMSVQGGVAYPGFINSHDHLDFNLFPALGNRVYANYREWGKDIQAHNRDTIHAILQVPEPIRTRWGMYKNLLHGFTTVVNHGKALVIEDPFINVHQDAHSLHSPGFERDWRWKLNDPFNKKRTVAIHIGEGTDTIAHEEINSLVRSNLLQKKLVGIHGVGMNTEQAKKFRALVWCPASNHFLLGKTANIAELKHHTPILFGSDSTLTAGWNIWEHFRTDSTALTQKELLNALTVTAAAVWELNDRGKFEENKKADLIIVEPPGKENRLLNGPEDILLVIQNGLVRLFDETLCKQAKDAGVDPSAFSRVRCKDRYKYVYGDLQQLAKETRQYSPDVVLPINIVPANA